VPVRIVGGDRFISDIVEHGGLPSYRLRQRDGSYVARDGKVCVQFHGGRLVCRAVQPHDQVIPDTYAGVRRKRPLSQVRQISRQVEPIETDGAGPSLNSSTHGSAWPARSVAPWTLSG